MIFILIPIISGIFGAILASGRDRNPFGWFLLCFFLPLIGHVLLAVLPQDTPAEQRPVATTIAQPLQISHASAPPTAPAKVIQQQPRAEAMSTLPPVHPAERWHYLVEYDPVLREAAEQLAPLGPQAIDKLRDAHFALQDHALIPSIVARIREKHTDRAARPAIEAPSVQPIVTEPPAKIPSGAQPRSQAAHHDPAPATASPIEIPHREAPLRSVAQFMPATAQRLVPRHTTVTPRDLETAEYRETHRGVHLYQLADGRVYIDGHMAVVSLDAARGLIDRAAGSASAETVAPAMVMHS